MRGNFLNGRRGPLLVEFSQHMRTEACYQMGLATPCGIEQENTYPLLICQQEHPTTPTTLDALSEL